MFAPLWHAQAALAQAPRGDTDTSAEIHARELSAHVEALASDAFGGRATGTEGARAAASYLAEQLRRAGVEPGGADGTFLQDAGLARRTWLAAPSLELETTSGERIALAWGVDFEIDNARPFEGRIELRVGSAPSASSPSASGPDARAPDANSPPASPAADSTSRPLRGAADARAPLGVVWDGGTRSQRDAWLAAHGYPQGRGLAALVLVGARKPGRPQTELPTSGIVRAASSSDAAEREPFVVRLRGEHAMRAANGEFGALIAKLGVADVALESGSACNVVGRLRARGARSAPGAILLSAHYDHLGVRAPRSASSAPRDASSRPASQPAPESSPAPGPSPALDSTYNGADDDASGCAAVLELAEACAALETRARELVIVFATAEEIGLLGTDHYIEHPLVPLEGLLCNLNFEMIGRPDAAAGPPGTLWLTGFERSNLGAAWKQAGLAIVPDPHPEQHFFERSDNIAFARRGIVAQTLSSYDLHADYHRPSDEWATLDYDHMELATRASLRALAPLLDGTLAAQWLPGGDPSKPKPRAAASSPKDG